MSDETNNGLGASEAKPAALPRAAFLGAGRMACALAKYLAECGAAELAGFWARKPERAVRAADFAGGRVFATPADAAADADLIFVAVSDSAITEVAKLLATSREPAGSPLAGKVVTHCSGAMASDALRCCREAGAAVASCHPIYAVSNKHDFQGLAMAWFTLEGDGPACELLEGVLEACDNSVRRIGAEAKPRYHASACMASNLVVALYDMAAEELAKCGFTREDAEDALTSLFLGNAEHVAESGAEGALTGPASRGDEATIEKHLAQLTGDNREVYELLTKRCSEIAERRG